MDTRSAQRLYAAAGYYRGAIDGQFGAKSREAMMNILYSRRNELPAGWQNWPRKRQMIAAAQIVLKHAGYQVGAIDGFAGSQTKYVLGQWDYYMSTGEVETPWRDQEEDKEPSLSFSGWPRQKQQELIDFFGYPGGDQCKRGKVLLPFTMKIAWNKSQKINSFSCHELIADSVNRVYLRIADAYSPSDISSLGFDLFGGCFNYRAKRGGTSLSTHAWGIAIDTDPERNQLRWNSDQAVLAKPECIPFWKCWEAEGFISLGRERNYDWMHVQAARL